jgi:hypothetical protein
MLYGQCVVKIRAGSVVKNAILAFSNALSNSALNTRKHVKHEYDGKKLKHCVDMTIFEIETRR